MIQIQSMVVTGFWFSYLLRRCSGSLTHFLILQNKCTNAFQNGLFKTGMTIIQFSTVLSSTGRLKVWEWLAGLSLHDIKSVINGCHTVPPDWFAGEADRARGTCFFPLELTFNCGLDSYPWEMQNDFFYHSENHPGGMITFSPWNITFANTVHWSHDLSGNIRPQLSVTHERVKEEVGLTWAIANISTGQQG